MKAEMDGDNPSTGPGLYLTLFSENMEECSKLRGLWDKYPDIEFEKRGSIYSSPKDFSCSIYINEPKATKCPCCGQLVKSK